MASTSYWMEIYQRIFVTIPFHGIGLMLICKLFSVYVLLYTNYWYIPLLYLVWMFTLDRNVHETGGRGFFWLRNLPIPELPFIFKTSSSYQLDSNRNYLFCCYPHGPLSLGVALAFIFEKGGFKNIFPNHNPYLTTMHGTYYFPFLRETPLAFNCCSASERSLNYLLSNKNGGNAVALIVGGSDEIAYSHKEDYNIILKRRKGFARVALKNGSPLVPVFSFGINSIYKYPHNKFLIWIQSVTGINLNLSYGQGIFHNWYGLVPFIKPVNTIVGEPIEVKKIDNPTREEVDKLHERFTNALIKLFDDHKHIYEKDGIKLVIIE